MYLWEKYKEIILYVMFGIGTTLINITVYYICAYLLNMEVASATAVAWILSIIFAYVTNKIWVFESCDTKCKVIIREIISFFLARVATGFLDIGLMYVFADLLKWNDMFVKIGINILVIVLNYMASKLLIFKRKK